MDGPTGSDVADWTASLGGDGEAFAVLFDRHHGRVYRHACRLVDTRHDAEDVTAAAFLELWRRRSAVRLVSDSVLPWLLVTTSNVARNLRRGLRRHEQFLNRLPRERGTPAADAADQAFQSDPWRDVDKPFGPALRELSAEDLQIITLVVIEGYSLADVAALLSLSLSATKARVHRARQRLRVALPERLQPERLHAQPRDTPAGAQS